MYILYIFGGFTHTHTHYSLIESLHFRTTCASIRPYIYIAHNEKKKKTIGNLEWGCSRSVHAWTITQKLNNPPLYFFFLNIRVYIWVYVYTTVFEQTYYKAMSKKKTKKNIKLLLLCIRGNIYTIQAYIRQNFLSTKS